MVFNHVILGDFPDNYETVEIKPMAIRSHHKSSFI